MPAASAYAMRTGLRTFGPDNQTVIISESLLDARGIFLTGNTETIYNVTWFDTHDGPLVIEVPAGVLGVIDDFWFGFVTDIGALGPDKGNGGKFLLLPPGYNEPVPEGYFVLNSKTYGHWCFFRVFIEGGDMKMAIDYAKKNYRAYPLKLAANPPAMNFIDFSGKYVNTVHSNNFLFYNEVNEVIQEEPLESVDPEVRGLLASIGIQKGKPFEPDARMKSILTDAAAVGNATARAIEFKTRDKEAYFYPNREGCLTRMPGLYTFTLQPAAARHGAQRWSASFLNTSPPNTMPQESTSMARRTTGCICHRISRQKNSGRWWFTTRKPALCCKPISKHQASAA
jgi:hypothetical protein